MKIQPMENRVLIEKKKAEEKTASGFLLTKEAQEETVLRATILDVGKGGNKELIGCTIVYRGYPSFFEDGDRELAFIMVDEIDGILYEEES